MSKKDKWEAFVIVEQANALQELSDLKARLILSDEEVYSLQKYLRQLKKLNKTPQPVVKAKSDVPEGYKRCTWCEQIKPLSEFYKQGDHYRSCCKRCYNEKLNADKREKRRNLKKVGSLCL